MLIRLDTLQPWGGEPIDDVRHPASIEELWSAGELAAIGLAVPEPFDVPPGKVAIGVPRYVQSASGIATEYDVEDAPAPPIPEELSRWQFYAAAALAGLITQAEAEAAITGPLPAPFAAFVASLPEAQRFPATMLLRGNQVFHRSHDLVAAFAAAQTPPMTAAQVDAIWIAGAALGAN